MTMQTLADIPNEDPAELDRFAELAAHWWDPEGPMRPLHVMNAPRLAFVAKHATLPGRTLCDVGTGGGLLAEAAARAGAEVTGIDANAPLIETARLHALSSGVTVHYETTTVAEHAQAKGGAYDIVTCLELIEHVPDPARLLRDCAALVKPGGRLFVSTINRNAIAYLGAVLAAEYVFRLLPRGTHDYQRFLRPSEVARLGREAGLELTACEGIRYVPVVQQASLTSDTRVNYIVCFEKPAA